MSLHRLNAQGGNLEEERFPVGGLVEILLNGGAREEARAPCVAGSLCFLPHGERLEMEGWIFVKSWYFLHC